MTSQSTPPPKVAVLGAINWDTTIFEQKFAMPGEEVPVLRVEEFPGGKGANTAVAAARILGRGRVAFLGALGNDQLRAPLIESFREEGVRSEGIRVVRGSQSGRAFIVVDGAGLKTIHTHFGANEKLEPRHLMATRAAATLSLASAVVIMDVPVRVALAATHCATKGNARIFYSPGVRSSEPIERLGKVLDLANELIVDRSELAKMTGKQAPKEGVATLARKFPHLVVVSTLGPLGCLISSEGSMALVEPTNLISLGLKAVNSTGSGDAFLAAYVCYSLFGLPPLKGAAWGNLAGALKAARIDTRGSPTRRELEAKMRLLKKLRGPEPGSP